MSVIDQALQHTASDAPALTVPEAIASLLVATIAVDGVVHPEEASHIAAMLATSRLMREAGNGSLNRLAERAIARLTECGLPATLAGCARVIPSDLRATAFALATDLALADGRMGDREKALLEQLQAVLHIDDATALKIVEVLVIKNRG